MSPRPQDPHAVAPIGQKPRANPRSSKATCVLAVILSGSPAALHAEDHVPGAGQPGVASSRTAAPRHRAGAAAEAERAAVHERPGTDAAIALPALTVTGRGMTGTDPVPGLVARVSATGTKTDTPLLAVPQAVSVIPRAQID